MRMEIVDLGLGIHYLLEYDASYLTVHIEGSPSWEHECMLRRAPHLTPLIRSFVVALPASRCFWCCIAHEILLRLSSCCRYNIHHNRVLFGACTRLAQGDLETTRNEILRSAGAKAESFSGACRLDGVRDLGPERKYVAVCRQAEYGTLRQRCTCETLDVCAIMG